LIVSKLIPKQGTCTITAESPDDLWTLRRLLAPGDTVVTKSSRVSKREGDYTRPNKGERISVTIALKVEGVSLDSSVGRLRIRGKIIEASDDSVTKAGSHSLLISPGQELTIKKEEWGPSETRILNSSTASERRFLLVAIDRREAGVGLLAGSHLAIISTLESGASGKGGAGTKEVDMQPYFRKVLELLKATWREGDVVVVAGAGNTKLTMENLIRKDPDLRKNEVLVDFFWSPVNTVDDLLADPQFHEGGGTVTVPDEEGGTTMLATPADFHGTPAGPRFRAPVLGEHTWAVLAAAGYGQDEIESLLAAGAVLSPPAPVG